jgi:hypothetical protein
MPINSPNLKFKANFYPQTLSFKTQIASKTFNSYTSLLAVELHTTKYQCHSTQHVWYNNAINNTVILGVFTILSQMLKLIGSFGQEMVWKYYVCSFICFEEDKRTQ